MGYMVYASLSVHELNEKSHSFIKKTSSLMTNLDLVFQDLFPSLGWLEPLLVLFLFFKSFSWSKNFYFVFSNGG